MQDDDAAVVAGFIIVVLVFAVLASPLQIEEVRHMPSNNYGVYVWTNATDAQLDLAEELGVGYVAIGNGAVWHWRNDSSYMSSIVDLCSRIRQRGMEPYVDIVLHATGQAAVTAADYASIASFAAERVSTLDLTQTVLQSEPDTWSAYVGTPANYVGVYTAAYPVIKAAAPDCIVLGSYGWGRMDQIYNDGSTLYYLDALVTAGLFNSIDGLSIHPYCANYTPETWLASQYSTLQTYLATKGKTDLPIYFDEWGYTLSSTTAGGGPRTEEEQADLVARTALTLYDLDHHKIIYFYLPYTTDTWGLAGGSLLNSSQTPRPAYNSYRLVVTAEEPEEPPTTADATVTIDQNTAVSTNNLELGFQLDGRDISQFVSSSTLRNLAEQANFKYVRAFHHRYAHYSQGSVYFPVTAWNNGAKDGTWNWTETDNLINAIIGIGAKPVICLMYKGSGIPATVPSGMTMWAVDGNLPDPDQYAAYCTKWVARYGTTIEYEIANEMMELYYWSSSTLVNRYVTWWDTIATAMRTENSNITLGDECPTELGLDEFNDQGVTLDFVAFHKYDSGGSDNATDSQLFTRAESEYHNPNYGSQDVYTHAEIRTEMSSSSFPVVVGEANINWDFNPSDSRIQTMTAAVWAAMTIRYQALQGTNYWLWWDLWGSGDSGRTQFSMISSSNSPWYSYQILKFFASNSEAGDSIVTSTCSSTNFRCLAWIHDDVLNLMVTHLATSTETLALLDVTGTFDYEYVDSSHRTPIVGSLTTSQTITFTGYSVMLLQQSTTSVPEPPLPPPPVPEPPEVPPPTPPPEVPPEPEPEEPPEEPPPSPEPPPPPEAPPTPETPPTEPSVGLPEDLPEPLTAGSKIFSKALLSLSKVNNPSFTQTLAVTGRVKLLTYEEVLKVLNKMKVA